MNTECLEDYTLYMIFTNDREVVGFFVKRPIDFFIKPTNKDRINRLENNDGLETGWMRVTY